MIRVGLIGAGAMGRLHAQTVVAHPQTLLAWVQDPHPERAAALARPLGAGVGPGPCDLTIVASPASTHAAVLAELSGWVLVEKPLTPTLDTARALVRPRLLVAHTERHVWDFPPGVPRVLESDRLVPYRERGGDVDVVADLLVHDLDLLSWRVGPFAIQTVSHWGRRPHDGVEVICSWQGGHARLRADRGTTSPLRRLRVDGEHLQRRTDDRDPLGRQLDGVLAQMHGTTSDVPTAEQTLPVLAILDRIRASA